VIDLFRFICRSISFVTSFVFFLLVPYSFALSVSCWSMSVVRVGSIGAICLGGMGVQLPHLLAHVRDICSLWVHGSPVLCLLGGWPSHIQGSVEERRGPCFGGFLVLSSMHFEEGGQFSHCLCVHCHRKGCAATVLTIARGGPVAISDTLCTDVTLYDAFVRYVGYGHGIWGTWWFSLALGYDTFLFAYYWGHYVLLGCSRLGRWIVR